MLSKTLLSLALLLAPSVLAKKANPAPVGYGRNGDPLPDLFTATIDDLRAGLVSGAFTTVDLVSVSTFPFILNCHMLIMFRINRPT